MYNNLNLNLFKTDTVEVAFGLELIQILGVDEKPQTVKMITWNTLVSSK